MNFLSVSVFFSFWLWFYGAFYDGLVFVLPVHCFSHVDIFKASQLNTIKDVALN